MFSVVTSCLLLMTMALVLQRNERFGSRGQRCQHAFGHSNFPVLWKPGVRRCYRLGDEPNIHNAKDVIKFWQSRPPVLREAVAPYLWYPVTGAAIERSFSLAGLIDVKNRQRMGKDLREACVTILQWRC